MPKKTAEAGPTRILTVLWEWRMQFIVLLVSCGLLGAIFGVLQRNHGQNTEYWSLSGMSLNALVATLSAILRAMILGILEEASINGSGNLHLALFVI
ncbi:unnamed protein product [Clonostachys rosea f. rosea IK726]|uniref:Uncharacterized protein n=1 Tax=Clonostachys rosea f. rosea IK726 TaxID=1349383 RepID=A0ACA9UJI5_BIOOC|nr:unnamed protein product [Clonostachys rosea f. rosea IK726]